MIRSLYTTIGAFLLFAVPTKAQNYFAVGSPSFGNGVVHRIDAATGASLNSNSVQLNGDSLDGFTGMAQDPTSGNVYVIAKRGSAFTLALLNLSNNTLTQVGPLSEKFAGITFSTTGVLYAISGDGAVTPETIYTVNKSNGASTLLVTLPEGGDGEAIAFNSSDGLLYRYGGDSLFHSVDPTSFQIVNHILPYNVTFFAHALVHDALSNTFAFTAGDTLYTLSTTGTLSNRKFMNGSADNGFKGLLNAAAVGINETDLLQDLELYPNPTAGPVSITITDPTVHAMTIFDASGKLVDSRSVQGLGTFTYGTQHLDNGIYRFVLTNGSSRSATRVVIAR